jgi:hypothetical protein
MKRAQTTVYREYRLRYFFYLTPFLFALLMINDYLHLGMSTTSETVMTATSYKKRGLKTKGTTTNRSVKRPQRRPNDNDNDNEKDQYIRESAGVWHNQIDVVSD